MWKHIKLWDTLKLNGVFYHNGVPAFVTPWMPAGNITEYLGKNPNANRLRLASSNVLLVSGISSLYILSPFSFEKQPKGSRTSIYWT